MQGDPLFFIGATPIYGDLILAPMAGYSDVPFRGLCRAMGSAISYTGCIPDDAVMAKGRRNRTLTDFREEERPVAVQLLARDERRLVRAALDLAPLRPDFVDLNLGCPARQVVSGGRGSALLCDPPLIGRLVSALVSALEVPVTAKIRLGWTEATRNHVEVARLLQESGVAAIAVHGRTRSQHYSGVADWEAIAEVKSTVKVPVFANGDVRTVDDIDAIRRITGCEAVMIGRGAVGNPWIFQRRTIEALSLAERLPVIERHLRAMVDYYGERLGVVIFRKHVVRYIQYLDGASGLRPSLIAAEEAEQVLDILRFWTPSA
jgi:nifR3 family TIM-barrel protein